MYASLSDMREEGITTAVVSDSRIEKMLDEATRFVDRVTGWFFEPREMTISLDGQGTPTIDTPVHCIELESVELDSSSIGLEHIRVIGAPVSYGYCVPQITRTDGGVFAAGYGNVKLTGVWGYTEDDGTSYGRIPLEIRRACMLLAMRLLPQLANTSALDQARSRWRLLEEKTRDQSYKLSPLSSISGITGDPEIDSILSRYSRPIGLGAA